MIGYLKTSATLCYPNKGKKSVDMWTTLASLRVDHIPTDSTTISFINFFEKN